MTTPYDARTHYRGEIASTYFANRRGEPHWLKEQGAVARFLRRVRRAGEVVLDLPFGTGRFAEFYSAGALKVVGVDVSLDMLHAARRLKAVADLEPWLVQGDGVSIPLRDQSVDHVVCTRLYNWLPEQERTRMLAEFARVARRNVLLQVRVGSSISGVGCVWSLARSSAASPREYGYRLRKVVTRTARATLNRLNSVTGPEKSAARIDAPTGYTAPWEWELAEHFRERGLLMKEYMPISRTHHPRQKAIFEKRLYLLEVSRIGVDR